MEKAQIHIRGRALCAAALILTLLAGGLFPAGRAYAAGGTIYACTITPSYRHPVTGVIEDSGGSASYATGQGMVEGAVYPTGMLEVTDGGEYYLTFRVSLVDFTTNHSFSVQNVGASGFSSTGMAVTGSGKDNNGATADICIQVPSESCVVRGSMYVTPMGRDVIFYFYPSNYAEGIPDGMTPSFVTEQSAGDGTAQNTGADASAGDETGTGAGTDTSVSGDPEMQNQQTDGAGTSGISDSSGLSDTGTSGSAGAKTGGNGSAPALKSSIDSVTPAAPAENAAGTGALSAAQGLSLSTAPDSVPVANGTQGASGQGMTALGLGLAITVSGLVLLCAVAAMVYYFRINWRRWGGDDDEE